MSFQEDSKLRTLQLKEFALQSGFSQIGFASVENLGIEFNQYQQWIELGYHGTMSYLEKASQRENIHELLPDAKTVIVVTQNYYTPYHHPSNQEISNNETIHGKISRYAWGEDYHYIVKEKLKAVEEYLQNNYPHSLSKSYVDTGPILEKAWAVKAGIGWQGKHSNIISRSNGSWFFIGIILSSLEFEYNSPILDYCGSCTACIDACPTNAIVNPYVVDGTKCISYWTIETKPDIDIPEKIASHLDNWVFGCDTCQDVCPWNRFQKESSEPLFVPKESETTLTFEQISSMTQEEFSQRFKKSPVKRTKLAGLQRNFRALQSDSDSKVKL
jgi:epoxyqueuosine reductase